MSTLILVTMSSVGEAEAEERERRCGHLASQDTGSVVGLSILLAASLKCINLPHLFLMFHSYCEFPLI